MDKYSGVKETTRELIYLYDESGMIGVMLNSQPYYYHRNLQGDVIAIYDANGEKQVEYAYDAWGNCKTVYGENDELAYLNPIRYRGYYYDTETKLYYLNARYYSPEWRRFISPDAAEYIDPETPNGLNLYAYCNNDPVNFADPSGHWIETVFDLFSLGASVVEVVINPANPWAWAGLVGDAVDLLPFVTGVGEGIRVTKMVKYADEVIDASYDTIKFVKAADMVDNFSDSGTMLRRVGNLDDYHTLTKTTHVDGTNLHTLFMGNGKTIADTRKRVDGINEITKSIFELKPYNLHSARRGVKQIINYNDLLGGGFKMVIVLY